MSIWKWPNVWREILVPVYVRYDYYGDGVWIIFAANLAQCIAFWANSLVHGWAYPIPFHLYRKVVLSEPNTLSLAKGEQNCVIFVEHVMGEEKYEWETLKLIVKESRTWVGRVCCVVFSGSLLGTLYLYFRYSHTISISKDCGGGTRPCVLYMFLLYCCHSHNNLEVGMVMRCLPFSS